MNVFGRATGGFSAPFAQVYNNIFNETTIFGGDIDQFKVMTGAIRVN